MKARDMTMGGLGIPMMREGALMVKQSSPVSIQGIADAVQVQGPVAITKAPTPASSQEFVVGAIALAQEYVSPGVQVGAGATVQALKVGPSMNVVGAVLEIQTASSAAGPWYASASGSEAHTLARSTAQNTADSVLTVRGRAMGAWVRVRYNPGVALGSGALIWMTWEASAR